MRKHFAALAAALPLLAAGAAQAATPFYGEIGYTRTEFDSSDVKAGLDTVDLRGGGQWGHWGAEMEAGTGVGDTSTTILGYDVKVKMNYEVGVYGVGFWPVTKDVDLFARVGAVGAQFHENVLGANGSNNEHGWAAGGGVRWFPRGGSNGLRLEYTRYGLQDDLNNYGVSFVHKF